MRDMLHTVSSSEVDTLRPAQQRMAISRAQDLAWEAGELSRKMGGRTTWAQEDIDAAAYAMKLVLLGEDV